MSVLSRLLAVFRPIPQPELLPALPSGKQRIHLLCGTFEDADAAMAYCYFAPDELPEKLTLEQPGAFIDTAFVEVDFGSAEKRLNEFLSPEETGTIIHKMHGANTLIIITESAFGGFPYVLGHTPTVHYIGPLVVDV